MTTNNDLVCTLYNLLLILISAVNLGVRLLKHQGEYDKEHYMRNN